MMDLLLANLVAPIPLAFALGVFARLVRSELSLPRELYASLSIYLLLAIGLKGGVELSHTPLDQLMLPGLATLSIGCLTPISAFVVLRWLGRFSAVDAAGIAAHYGSVSAVTFIAAQQYTERVGSPAEGFMPTLLTLLESPGIHIALGLGVLGRTRGAGGSSPGAAGSQREALREVVTGRSMILLVGGLLIGYLTGREGWSSVAPFFEAGFKGALMLFLLEMGIVAATRLADLRRVGWFLLGFGVVMPVLHGALGVVLGHLSGLSTGGATVLGTMAASASYIAAPPAVRLTLPEANPTYSLTASLAITFPFNLVFGIPLFHQIAQAMG